jgi:hypothetical protein
LDDYSQQCLSMHAVLVPPHLVSLGTRQGWTGDLTMDTLQIILTVYNQAPILILLTAQPCIFLV